MDESSEQQYDRIKDQLQQSILRDYPNPNRERCPGNDAVRQVAARTELLKDEVWQHITHCSPCYAEFLQYKDEFRTRSKHRLQTRRRALIVGSLTVVAGGGVSVLLLRDREVYNVDWDLESQRTFRGLEDGQMEGPSGPPLSAPNGRLHVSIKMPKDSQPGQYVVQFWKNLDVAPLFSRTIQLTEGSSRVTLEANLTGVVVGPYTLGVRRSPVSGWRYFPVTVTSS